MGKRKKAAKKPTGPRKNEPLATSFACLFCNHEKSVSVKLDKKAGVGHLSCKVCGQSFQCSVNYLSAAVDVYSEWVDACDSVAKEDDNEGREKYISRAILHNRASTGGGQEADDIDDEEGLDGYEGEGIVRDDEY